MNDKIGNTIELSSDPNGHVLILGQTGQGKTYELCRLVEDYCGQGKRILIIDYSGSFTERELVEKGFQCGKHIKRVNLAKEEFKWCFRVRNIIDAIDDIADVILDVVKCEAYFQRKWMYQMIKELMGKRGYVSIPEIIQRLENKLYDEQLSESIHGNVEEVGKLLTRLEIYRRFKDFYICPFDKEDNADDKLIYILDVTEFPKRQRDFLSELMISLLWKETYRQEVKNRCEIVILDEFQHIPFNGNSAVSGILREGRKRNLSAILSTQHTGRYSKEQIQTLQQAGNIIFFKPTEDEIRTFARIIDSRNSKIWEEKISNLERGQAILKGSYTINGRQRRSPIRTPIIICT